MNKTDLVVTLTYHPQRMPPSDKIAGLCVGMLTNTIRKRYARANSYNEISIRTATHCDEKSKRIHHHLIMEHFEGAEEMIADLWKEYAGGVAAMRRVGENVTAMNEYITRFDSAVQAR